LEDNAVEVLVEIVAEVEEVLVAEEIEVIVVEIEAVVVVKVIDRPKCTQLLVQLVTKAVRYHSVPQAISQFIVVNVSANRSQTKTTHEVVIVMTEVAHLITEHHVRIDQYEPNEHQNEVVTAMPTSNNV
jgi:hypothetical protein